MPSPNDIVEKDSQKSNLINQPSLQNTLLLVTPKSLTNNPHLESSTSTVKIMPKPSNQEIDENIEIMSPLIPSSYTTPLVSKELTTPRSDLSPNPSAPLQTPDDKITRSHSTQSSQTTAKKISVIRSTPKVTSSLKRRRSLLRSPELSTSSSSESSFSSSVDASTDEDSSKESSVENQKSRKGKDRKGHGKQRRSRSESDNTPKLDSEDESQNRKVNKRRDDSEDSNDSITYPQRSPSTKTQKKGSSDHPKINPLVELPLFDENKNLVNQPFGFRWSSDYIVFSEKEILTSRSNINVPGKIPPNALRPLIVKCRSVFFLSSLDTLKFQSGTIVLLPVTGNFIQFASSNTPVVCSFACFWNLIIFSFISCSCSLFCRGKPQFPLTFQPPR